MRTSKFISIGLMLSAVLFLTQCETPKYGCTDPKASNYNVAADEDDGSCNYGVNNNDYCTEDSEGNLTITNQTNEKLLLYNDFVYVQCIPAEAENFLVNVENLTQGDEKYILQIWKATDVENSDEPSIYNAYRQWTVVLSNTTVEAEHTSWVITDNRDYDGSGTLLLSYPDSDDYGQTVIYQVDVYLNSSEGALITSLQPGTSKKTVNIDYGVHYLYFHYWYSDPNSQSGTPESIGSLESSPIVINYEHQESNIAIPVYTSNLGKFGEIEIFNKTLNPITIYADGAQIETIAKVDGSTAGLSTIPANTSTTFLIPVESYSIVAKNFQGTSTIESFKGIDVLEGEKAVLTIGIDLQTIELTNNTDEVLMLYSVDMIYLGAVIKSGEDCSFDVSAAYDSLVVFNGNKSKTLKFAITEPSINELDEYQTTSFEITESWTEISSGHYQSLLISDNSTTTMTASLTNYENVEFSFDFKVSSEPNYDHLSVIIDGTTHLENLSGEINWTNFSISFEPGTHTIQWIYEKDFRDSQGNDNIEIKNITIN